jgi:hypothetical protein
LTFGVAGKYEEAGFQAYGQSRAGSGGIHSEFSSRAEVYPYLASWLFLGKPPKLKQEPEN